MDMIDSFIILGLVFFKLALIVIVMGTCVASGVVSFMLLRRVPAGYRERGVVCGAVRAIVGLAFAALCALMLCVSVLM